MTDDPLHTHRLFAANRARMAAKFAAAGKADPEIDRPTPPPSLVDVFSDERARREASCLAHNQSVGLTRNRVSPAAAAPELRPGH